MTSLQQAFSVLSAKRSALKCQAALVKKNLFDLLNPICVNDETDGLNVDEYPALDILEYDRRLCAVREIIQHLNGSCNAIIDNDEWKLSIDTIVASNCDRRHNLEINIDRLSIFAESGAKEELEIKGCADELDVLFNEIR